VTVLVATIPVAGAFKAVHVRFTLTCGQDSDHRNARYKYKNDVRTRQRVNEALDVAGLSYDGDLNVRHACEVLVNDVGLDKIKEQVTNPLTGLKVAGYVDCQTVRPFAATDSGDQYDTYDQPEFLDNFVKACGAEAVAYDPKTSCCGDSVSVYSPDKTLHLIKKILQAAVDAGADVVATPVPPVPAECRDVPGCDQQEIRHQLRHPGGVLQPVDGGRLRHGHRERRRARPQHDQAAQAGGTG
jgi:heterodisulfide reductase subunit B